MSSLTSKDRVPLCLFTFVDGRRCRTPRISSHPHICYYHAQKEARARATEELGKDLAYFFSGDYLSACNLSTALARLIPAVVRGDIKPRLARTVAYMFQTQLQAIHLSQDEYINAFSTDGWRKAVRNSVNSNSDYLFPPDPEPAPEPPQPAPPAPPQTQQQAPAPAPVLQPRPTPAPTPQSPTSHTATSSPHANSPANQSAAASAQSSMPNSAPAHSVARSMFRRRPNTPPLTPLKAISTHPRATVDSKLLTRTPSPLSATLTQNRGDGGHLHLDDMGCCSISGRCAAVVGAQHAVPDLGNQHQIEITRIEAGEELNTHTENYLFGAATVASPSACITASCKAGRTSAIL